MTSPIGSLGSQSPVAWPAVTSNIDPSAHTTGFDQLLAKSWQETNGLTMNAQSTVESSLIGEDLSMVETFTAMREADVALRLMLQIRNKLVDAYQELQQMRF